MICIFGMHAFDYVTNVADIQASSVHEILLSTINYLIGEYCKNDDAKYFAIRVTVTFLVRAAQRRGGMRWVMGWDLAESRILENGIG
jgi:hypothetical protein